MPLTWSDARLYAVFGALLLLVAYVVWVLWLGRRWRWPQGTRVEGSYLNFRVTLVYDDEAGKLFRYDPQTIADACALASFSLATAWLGLKSKRGWVANIDSLTHVVVHVLGDHAYTKTYAQGLQQAHGFNIHPAGTLTMMRMHTGSEARPLVACRAARFESTPVTGSLVIHELVHHLVELQHEELPLARNDWYDSMHSLADFWASRSSLSLESTGTGIYLKLREKAGIKA